MYNRFLFILLASASLTLAGCVSKQIEPEPIRSSTSQNHEGMVTISWQSRIGYRYRLVAYEHGRIFKDEKVYPGTGDTIVVHFMRDPSKPLPEYRVMDEKADAR